MGNLKIPDEMEGTALIELNFSFLNAADTNLLKKKLDTLKRQTVTIHNDIVSNNKELKKIKIGENIGRRLMFLLQEKIYQSPVTKIVKNLFFQSEDFVTKRIVREFFLKRVRTGINEYLQSFKKITELNEDLDEKLSVYKKKKKSLAVKLITLEKKNKRSSETSKKVKVDVKLRVKEKRFKEKAKNLNELVQGV